MKSQNVALYIRFCVYNLYVCQYYTCPSYILEALYVADHYGLHIFHFFSNTVITSHLSYTATVLIIFLFHKCLKQHLFNCKAKH